MNIDQRLEALAQSLELTALVQQENEKRIEALSHSVERVAAMQLTTEKNFASFTEFAKLVLANHEERIRKFENG